MLISQYQSRRDWNLIPTEGPVIVLWWKITENKRNEDLKSAKVFVELFVDENKYTAKEQEKTFVATLKGYGAVMSRRESTIDKINKKI